MFFEPFLFPNERLETNFFLKDAVIEFPNGFDVPPGGQKGSPYHALNSHTYCFPSDDKTDEEKKQYCIKFHEARIKAQKSDAKRLGLAFFLSEFGACLNTKTCDTELTTVTDICERELIGWSYW